MTEKRHKMSVGSFIRVDADEYIPIEEFQGQLDPDASTVPGSLEIRVDGEVFLARDDWEDIDCFWLFIIKAMRDLPSEKDVSAPFPDQPREIEMTLQTEQVQLVVDRGDSTERTARVSAATFARSMFREARRFFEFLLREKPSKKESWEGDLEYVSKAEREWNDLLSS